MTYLAVLRDAKDKTIGKVAIDRFRNYIEVAEFPGISCLARDIDSVEPINCKKRIFSFSEKDEKEGCLIYRERN